MRWSGSVVLWCLHVAVWQTRVVQALVEVVEIAAQCKVLKAAGQTHVLRHCSKSPFECQVLKAGQTRVVQPAKDGKLYND